MKRPLFPLHLLALAIACGCSRPEARAAGVRGALDATLTSTLAATLTTGRNPLLADPIGLYVDQGGRFVAVDRSDKAVKVYDAHGNFLFAAGRPGQGPGEFAALWGGGTLGPDSIFGYDFGKTSVAVFSPSGEYVRSFPVRRRGEGVPASVLPVDDSLLLVVGFPLDSWRHELLRLVRRDGSVRSRFFDRSAYFTPERAPLLESSYVVADAGDGIVVAGLRGGDSLWVFDYDGHRLASAPIQVDERTLGTYRRLIEGNRGKARRPDGSWVIDGHEALLALVVVDGSRAVLQVMRTDLGEQPWVDLTEGGRFLVAEFDRASGTLRIGGDTRLVQGLVGRDRQGHPLMYRYLGERFDSVQVSRLTLAAGPGARGGGR